MTEKAKLVIIGAGIAGASAAVELTKLGWKDILLIDKGSIHENDGSSSHAPGGVGAINHSKLMTDFAQYATKMYAELENFPHESHIYSDPNFSQARNTYNPTGGIELARSKERWEDMKRLHSASKSFGLKPI